MGKGLPWNGAASTDKPLIFGPTPTLINNWPSATTGDSSNPSYQDPDYERIGPQIFRFEYSYFLKNGTLAVDPGAPGLQDVAAISVCIAAVDPKSKALLDNSKQVAPPNDNITKLAGKLRDYTSGMQPGQLLGSWQDVLDNNKNPDSDIAAMPRPAISAIRIYERYFHLLPKP